MKKLLNTLYITTENAYLSLDGENVVVTAEGKELFRIPFANVESIVCFNYPGVSPALMGKCAKTQTGLCFLTPQGRFLARVTGETKGNVFSRKRQLELFENPDVRIKLIRNCIAAKLVNTRFLLNRSLRDHPERYADGELQLFAEKLAERARDVYELADEDALRGLEGECAKAYFFRFDSLILPQDSGFRMTARSKHPPLDELNAVLSFLYTVCTNDLASALESVGLDPYIGFFHTLRPGRVSLACDLMEELRCIVERLVLSLINLRTLQLTDFERQSGGAVLLNEEGRKKVITAWQQRKKDTVVHPYLKQKIQLGLVPYVQANLLAKYVRGEVEEYPPFVLK